MRFVLMLLLLASPVAADPLEIAMVSAQMGDLATTELRLRQGYLEANPFMQNDAVRPIAKVAFTATSVLIYRSLRKNKPTAAKVVAVLVIGFGLGAMVHNITVRQ